MLGRQSDSVPGQMRGGRRIAVCGWPLLVGLPLIAILLSIVGCGGDDSPRVSLQGVVRVNGDPAERMLVQLHYQGPSESAGESLEVEGNDKYPSGLTDQAGQFRVANGAATGVLPGRYAVTFTWLSSDGLDARDKFDGRYADAERTEHFLDVPRDVVESVQFELTTP